eukprot:tig00021525_g22131.t1
MLAVGAARASADAPLSPVTADDGATDLQKLSEEELRVFLAALEPRRRAAMQEMQQHERARRRVEIELASRGVDVAALIAPRSPSVADASPSPDGSYFRSPAPPPPPPPTESPTRRRPSSQMRLRASWTPTSPGPGIDPATPNRRPSLPPSEHSPLPPDEPRPSSAPAMPQRVPLLEPVAPRLAPGTPEARRPSVQQDLPAIVEEGPVPPSAPQSLAQLPQPAASSPRTPASAATSPRGAGRVHPALFPRVYPDVVPLAAVREEAARGAPDSPFSPPSTAAADWALLWIHYLTIAALPPGWDAERDTRGRPFYFHPDTCTSTRLHPAAIVRDCVSRLAEVRADLGSLPAYWSDDYAASGRPLRAPSCPAARPYLLFAPWVPVAPPGPSDRRGAPPPIEFVNLVTGERSAATPAEALERAALVITSAIRAALARRRERALRQALGLPRRGRAGRADPAKPAGPPTIERSRGQPPACLAPLQIAPPVPPRFPRGPPARAARLAPAPHCLRRFPSRPGASGVRPLPLPLPYTPYPLIERSRTNSGPAPGYGIGVQQRSAGAWAAHAAAADRRWAAATVLQAAVRRRAARRALRESRRQRRCGCVPPFLVSPSFLWVETGSGPVTVDDVDWTPEPPESPPLDGEGEGEGAAAASQAQAPPPPAPRAVPPLVPLDSPPSTGSSLARGPTASGDACKPPRSPPRRQEDLIAAFAYLFEDFAARTAGKALPPLEPSEEPQTPPRRGKATKSRTGGSPRLPRLGRPAHRVLESAPGGFGPHAFLPPTPPSAPSTGRPGHTRVPRRPVASHSPPAHKPPRRIAVPLHASDEYPLRPDSPPGQALPSPGGGYGRWGSPQRPAAGGTRTGGKGSAGLSYS